MALRQLDVGDLPKAPLDAAATFFARDLPKIRNLGDSLAGHDLAIVFRPAPHTHRGWRLAAIQELARELAPLRVNGIVGDDAQGIARTLSYLDRAPGVTGQVLDVASG